MSSARQRNALCVKEQTCIVQDGKREPMGKAAEVHKARMSTRPQRSFDTWVSKGAGVESRSRMKSRDQRGGANETGAGAGGLSLRCQSILLEELEEE